MKRTELQLSGLNDNCFRIHLLQDGQVHATPSIPGILADFPFWRLSLSDRRAVAGISEKLHLDFFTQPPGEGRVCFVGSPEIRNDFRTYFTIDDLKLYIHAALSMQSLQMESNDVSLVDFLEIPYPTDLDGFWEMVEQGKQAVGES